MARWVVLLRAVNVGGTSVVRSADLRAALAPCVVVLQSGNVVLDHDGDAAQVTADVEARLAAALGLTNTALVRSPAELAALADPARWPAELPGKGGHVWFLAHAPAPDAVDAARALASPTERLDVDGAHALLAAPDGIGRSKLAAALERRLGVPGTARNLNTVRRLLDVAGRP